MKAELCAALHQLNKAETFGYDFYVKGLICACRIIITDVLDKHCDCIGPCNFCGQPAIEINEYDDLWCDECKKEASDGDSNDNA